MATQYIRSAVTADLSQIFDIYQSHALDRSRLDDIPYRSDIEKHGFLLGLDTKTDYDQLITSASFFYVYEHANEILGYMVAQVEREYVDNDLKVWLNKELKEAYYHDPQSISLTEMAVKKDHADQGIASQLLAYLESELKDAGYRYLFSVVTVSPVENRTSVQFHENHGFQHVGKGKPTTLFNISNYASLLYGKVL